MAQGHEALGYYLDQVEGSRIFQTPPPSNTVFQVTGRFKQIAIRFLAEIINLTEANKI